MAYEIPYDSNYGEWYGIPQNVTRLSAVLEQATDENGNGIGKITASWDMPDNGGTFIALTSTDGENYTIAETNIRQNNVVLTVLPSTDYYLKIVTVLDTNQSSGTVSELLSAVNIPTPNAPVITVTLSGLRIDVGIIPQGYTASIAIDNGEIVDFVDTSNLVYMYLCSAGTYDVSTAFMDVNGNIGDYSSTVSVTVDDFFVPVDYIIRSGETITSNEVKSLVIGHKPISINGELYYFFKENDGVYYYGNENYNIIINADWELSISHNNDVVYNLKTPVNYNIVDDLANSCYIDGAESIVLDNPSGPTRKSYGYPAIRGYYNDGGSAVPLLMSLVADGVTMHRGSADVDYNTKTYEGIYHDEERNLDWYYNHYTYNLNHFGSWTVEVGTPLLNNGVSMSVTDACMYLLKIANSVIVPSDYVEENLFYPTNVAINSGDTITDETLKALIAYHRPININGTVYIPSDFTNGVYTYYALKNGTSSAEIGKIQVDSSSWIITITTESGGGGGYVLPIASSSTLGGIKVGNNLTIDVNGVLSATGGGGGGDVTTNTDQNITGVKTFVGQKRVLFKQASSTDKLGFTLYTDSNSEKGFLEYNPQNLIDNVPLFTIGNHADGSGNLAHIGFRKLSRVSGASGAYNLLTPLIADARTPFNLTTNYTTFYLPLGVTDGTTMVKTDKRGVLDISTLLPTIPIASANTLGGIKVGTNLSIDANGVLSAKDTTYSVFVGSGASASSGLVPAPPTTAGATKFLREDGSWSVPSGGGGGGGSYSAGDGIDITNDVISLEKASANGLGGIKVGSGLSIDDDGVLSATGGGGGGFSQILIYSGNWVGGQIALTESIQNFDDFAIIYNNGSRSDLAWAVTTFVIKDILASSTSSSPVSFYGEASRKFSFYRVDDTHLAMESRDTYGIKRIYGRKY